MPIILERESNTEMPSNRLDELSAQGEREPQEYAVAEGRRSLLQIRIDVLKAVASGFGKPTQIMYRANLSWNVLQAQLKSFLESDMLEVEQYGSRRRYMITPKGVEMIDSYQRVEKEILR